MCLFGENSKRLYYDIWIPTEIWIQGIDLNSRQILVKHIIFC